MVKIGLHGANGKVCQEISRQADHIADITISYTYSKSTNSNLDDLFTSSDIIIDFSNYQAISSLLGSAVRHKKPLVIGTTGLSQELFDEIKEAGKHIPIFYSANMSPGVFVVTQLLKNACETLGPEYNIRIIETHHKHKQDAPSGTALSFEESIKHFDPERHIDISSIREGEELGTHEILFSNQFETISIKHQANSRALFVIGAINIAKWLRNKQLGLYKIDDFIKI